jgi:RNA polymerase sigma-70 factor (ECF subfamily)
MECGQNTSSALARPEKFFNTRMKQSMEASREDLLLLIDRVKEGDREAFMALTRAHQKSVFLVAFSFFHNREDALDIVQETFLRLYKKIHLFNRDKNFKNWLMQITKNLCIDHYRKNAKKDFLIDRDKRVEEMNISAREKVENHQDAPLKDVITSCLNQLTEKQRNIFMMKHYNDLEYREIAEILNIAMGTVKSLHFKAVRNLRVLMSPYVGRTT